MIKRELQQLIGKLNWAAKMVRAARPFMHRIITPLSTASHARHHLRLSAAAKQDLAWLKIFSMQFNGVAYWISSNPLCPTMLWSDSDASSYAAAAVHTGDYFYSSFRVVVVVNHCFTSLFGTTGLLNDIVIR